MAQVHNNILHYRGFLNFENDDIYSIKLNPEAYPPVIQMKFGHLTFSLKVDSVEKYKILDTMCDELKFVLKCASGAFELDTDGDDCEA